MSEKEENPLSNFNMKSFVNDSPPEFALETANQSLITPNQIEQQNIQLPTFKMVSVPT